MTKPKKKEITKSRKKNMRQKKKLFNYEIKVEKFSYL